MSDTIAYVDSLNMMDLKTIIKKHGYPDENLIGLSSPRYFNPPHYIVIRHYYQSKHYDLTDLLFESMKQGKLSPRVFAELEDKKSNGLGKGDKYGTVGFFMIQGHEDKVEYSEEVIKILNENRKKIGLESWGDYLRKIQFQETQKEFYFGITEGRVRLEGITWKQWNKMKTNN